MKLNKQVSVSDHCGRLCEPCSQSVLSTQRSSCQ